MGYRIQLWHNVNPHRHEENKLFLSETQFCSAKSGWLNRSVRSHYSGDGRNSKMYEDRGSRNKRGVKRPFETPSQPCFKQLSLDHHRVFLWLFAMVQSTPDPLPYGLGHVPNFATDLPKEHSLLLKFQIRMTIRKLSSATLQIKPFCEGSQMNSRRYLRILPLLYKEETNAGS